MSDHAGESIDNGDNAWGAWDDYPRLSDQATGNITIIGDAVNPNPEFPVGSLFMAYYHGGGLIVTDEPERLSTGLLTGIQPLVIAHTLHGLLHMARLFALPPHPMSLHVHVCGCTWVNGVWFEEYV
jgi:hypothetical protein